MRACCRARALVSHFHALPTKKCWAKTGFSKKWHKIMVRGSRPKFLATPCFLTEISSKMILGSGGLRSVIFSDFQCMYTPKKVKKQIDSNFEHVFFLMCLMCAHHSFYFQTLIYMCCSPVFDFSSLRLF